jgi:hypothetical protein
MVSARLSVVTAADADAPPSRSEPLSLDDLIAETQHLLPAVHDVSAAELRTLARKLRILANYAEAWAERTERAKSI